MVVDRANQRAWWCPIIVDASDFCPPEKGQQHKTGGSTSIFRTFVFDMAVEACLTV